MSLFLSDHSITELNLIPASKEVYDALVAYLLAEGLTYVEQSLESDIGVSECSPDDLIYNVAIYFEQASKSEYWFNRLKNLFGEGRLKIKINKLSNSIWQMAWDETLHDVASKRFWVHQKGLLEDPSYVALEKITIDARNAFGTGQHATTLASLRLIEELPVANSFLDVGTGTGILAIAAKKMGFKYIAATDIDRDAIESAKVNFALNQCDDIQLYEGSFPDQTKRFDVVVSNILVPEVLRLLPELIQCMTDTLNASLILSGFHEANEDMVIDAVRTCGLTLVARNSERSWLALAFRRIA